MEMRSDWKREAASLAISVDLQALKDELDLLARVDQDAGGRFYDGDFLEQAVRRYQFCWIPLMAAHSADASTDLLFCPPLDVLWVWQVHMLSPLHYHRDLHSSPLRRKIHFKMRHWEQQQRLMAATEPLWKAMFSEQPFWPPSALQPPAAMEPGFTLTYDIKRAALRQQHFFYQVSLPHFRQASFLQSAILRYKQFLMLKRCHPDTFLVPCYDIDLVWHTHQVHPYEYEAETVAVMGFVLPHDDSVNDRSPGSTLSQAHDVTRRLWKDMFGEDFDKAGCMFRGPSPRGRLLHLGPDSLDPLRGGQVSELRLTQLEFAPDLGSIRASIKSDYLYAFDHYPHFSMDLRIHMLPLARDQQDGWSSPDARRSIPLHVGPFSRTSSTARAIRFPLAPPDAVIFRYEAGLDPVLTFTVQCEALSRSRFAACCFGFGSTEWSSRTEQPLSLKQLVAHSKDTVDAENLPPVERSFSVALSGKLPGRISGCLHIRPLGLQPVWKTLGIEAGSYYDCVIPEQAEQLWGPVPLKGLSPDQEHRCKAVTHRLVDYTEMGPVKSLVTVYLLHSLSEQMSVVQIFLADQMAVVGHLVGPDTVAGDRGLQLDDEFLSGAWRGMLIKDEQGDWGLCVAAWKGLVPGKSGIPGGRGRRPVKGVPGKPGYFKMFFRNLRTLKTEAVILPMGFCSTFARQYRFSLAGNHLQVDFTTGLITIGPELSGNLLQYVCLAFATSLLYLMVQPCPGPNDNHAAAASRPGSRPMFLDSASLLLLAHCGWNIRDQIPTNSTLRHLYGGGFVQDSNVGGFSEGGEFGLAALLHGPAEDDGCGCGGCGGCVSGVAGLLGASDYGAATTLGDSVFGGESYDLAGFMPDLTSGGAGGDGGCASCGGCGG